MEREGRALRAAMSSMSKGSPESAIRRRHLLLIEFPNWQTCSGLNKCELFMGRALKILIMHNFEVQGSSQIVKVGAMGETLY